MLLDEGYHRRLAVEWSKRWRALFVIAVMNGVQIAMNNSALTLLELSLVQVLRCTGVVTVAFFAYTIEGKKPTAREMACLCTISFGAAMVVAKGFRSTSSLVGASLVSHKGCLLPRPQFLRQAFHFRPPTSGHRDRWAAIM